MSEWTGNCDGLWSPPAWWTLIERKRRENAVAAVEEGLTGYEDNGAILQKAKRPAAGKLVFVPYQAGGKCIPRLGGGEDEDAGGM